jgi:hypothetical protein
VDVAEPVAFTYEAGLLREHLTIEVKSDNLEYKFGLQYEPPS